MNSHLVFPCLKRALCALCAAILCLAVLPSAALAEEDYSYTYPEDYTGIINPSVPYDPLLEYSDIPPEERHVPNTEQGPAGLRPFALTPSMVPASYSYPRVLLSTSAVTVNVTFYGNYCLYNAGGSAVLAIVSGMPYTFAVAGSEITLSAGGVELYRAEQFNIKEHTPPEGMGRNKFTLANSEYGIKSYYGSLSAHFSSGLKLVNRVYIDDYLCGVVPNEIGDGFGAAALGAQTVAARNYVYNYHRPSSYYDLGDTTTHQVYKGISGATNTPAAVAATKGQILYYDGMPLENIYYGASNGGVTELTSHRWTVDHTYPPYIEIVADPYDLQYSQNYGSNSYLEETVVSQTGDSKGMLRTMLKNALALTDAEAGTIQFTDVTLSADCLHNINYTESDGTVRNYAGFREIYRGVKKDDTKIYCSQFLTLTAVVSCTYTKGGQPCTLTNQSVTIEKSVLGNGNYGFTNTSLGCFWLIDNQDGTYTVRHGRYGHGIGMSQIGARQMSAQGFSVSAILQLYYPNTTLAVSPNYTDAEELTDLPTTLSDGRAVVNNGFIYATANTDSIKLGLAKAGDKLVVTGTEGVFYVVNYNGRAAYVAKSAFTPVYGKIKIVNVTTSCNVRSGPSTNYTKIGDANLGTLYTLLDMNAAPGWYKIVYSSKYPIAYVSTDYAELVADTPASIATYPITVTRPAGYTDTTLWVDGIPAYTTVSGGNLIAEVYATTARTVTMYQYDSQGIPLGSYAWTLSYSAAGGYTATALPDLQNLLSYQGCAIRVTGVTGLRFISGIGENLRKQLLTTAGVGGYRLKEYGTVVINGALMTYYPFTKGAPGTAFGVSYDSKNDVSIDKQDGRIWYASVMTNIPVESYKTKQGFRAYAILEKSGIQYVFYGPQIDRSLYYVATQVMAANEFAEGTDAYAFVKGIIDAADAGGGG